MIVGTYADCGIVLENKYVSRKHMKITLEGEKNSPNKRKYLCIRDFKMTKNHTKILIQEKGFQIKKDMIIKLNSDNILL